MKMKMNSGLLPVKAHFFFFFAGTASILPYMPVYAKQLGIDEIGVTIVFAVLPFMGMIAKPLFGWMADRYKMMRTIFISSIGVATTFYSLLLLLHDIPEQNPVLLQCSSPYSVLNICRGEEQKQLFLDTASFSCPVQCELWCDVGIQQGGEAIMKSICEAFDYKPEGCFNDTSALDLTHIQMIVTSNMTAHDTQLNPGCLIFPLDTARLLGHPGHQADLEQGFICPQDGHVELSCQAKCEHDEMRRFVRTDHVSSSATFWLFFLINIIAFSAFSVTCSIGDAICFLLLEGKHQNYGLQRVFGSIGWGSFTVLAGYLVDSYSKDLAHGDKNYSPALLLLLGMILFDLVCVSRMKIALPPASPSSTFREMYSLLLSPRVALFFTWCTTVGILTSVIWQWLPWYLTDLARDFSVEANCNDPESGLEWTTLLLGLNMAIQCFVGEVPMFFLAGNLITKLGHTNTMTLVLLAFSLRFTLYSFLSNPWFSLPVEILNGVTFGIFYSTMTSYAHLISPAGLGSTVQGLVGGAFEGLGVALGSIICGPIYKAHGGHAMFRILGVFSFVATILHCALDLLLARRARTTHISRAVLENNVGGGGGVGGASGQSAVQFSQLQFSPVPTRDDEDDLSAAGPPRYGVNTINGVHEDRSTAALAAGGSVEKVGWGSMVPPEETPIINTIHLSS